MRMLACTAVAAAVFVAGCIGGGDEAQPTADPNEKSAKGAEAAATEAFESYAAGNYGGFWDIWAPEAQDALPREDYVKGMRECSPVAQGWPFDITKVHLVDDGERAVVAGRRTSRDLPFTYSFVYIDGKWRFTPLMDQQAAYQQGYDAWVTFMRQRGACSTATSTWTAIY